MGRPTFFHGERPILSGEKTDCGETLACYTGYLSEQGFSVEFTQRRTNLKTCKVLDKPSFYKSKCVTDWSNLMIICFTSYIPFTLNAYVR